ncbi:MAG: radical SAM protein [Patescibacteria group bacterium]
MADRPIDELELSSLLDSETVQILTDEGILVTSAQQDADVLGMTRERSKKEITLELLYLLVTDGCNLKCRYCFEETPTGAGDFLPTTMSLDTARRAMDSFARLATRYGDPAKTKVIHLYGGEPMLNPDAVKYSVEYAAELKQGGQLANDAEITIVTNGTLMTAEQAAFFARNGVTVGLSLDGPRGLNNLYRIGKRKGWDVYESVMQTYELLRNSDVKIGLSVTLTAESIERFDELLDFFERLDGVKGFSLNLMHFNHGVSMPENYYVKAVECQLAAFEIFRKKGLYEERVMRKAKSFVDRRVMYADCGVVGYQLVVAPDGKVGVCQDFVKPRTYFNGSVFDPDLDPIRDGLFADWIERSTLNMPECRSCAAIGLCGGGCPASAELKYGSRWHVDDRICYHSLKVLEWLIWDTYAKLL